MTQNKRMRVRKINIVHKMTIQATNKFKIGADTLDYVFPLKNGV